MKITPLSVEDQRKLTGLNSLRFKDGAEGSVVELFEEMLATYRKYNDTSEGAQLHGHQGICQFLDQLLEIINTASDTVHNMNKVDKVHGTPTFNNPNPLNIQKPEPSGMEY